MGRFVISFDPKFVGLILAYFLSTLEYKFDLNTVAKEGGTNFTEKKERERGRLEARGRNEDLHPSSWVLLFFLYELFSCFLHDSL